MNRWVIWWGVIFVMDVATGIHGVVDVLFTAAAGAGAALSYKVPK